MTPPNPSPNVAPQGKPAVLPLVALALSLVGLCVLPLFPVGVVLAIISLARAAQPAYAARKVFAIVSLALAVVYVPVAVLAAIAVPNFLRFQQSAKQMECKENLRSLYAAEQAFFAAHARYTEDVAELHFTPAAPHRGLYRLSADGPLARTGVAPRHPQADPVASLEAGLEPVRERLGVHGACPDCALTAACALNVDTDATVDVWTVSTERRGGPEGEVAPGVPRHEVDDLNE